MITAQEAKRDTDLVLDKTYQKILTIENYIRDSISNGRYEVAAHLFHELDKVRIVRYFKSAGFTVELTKDNVIVIGWK